MTIEGEIRNKVDRIKWTGVPVLNHLQVPGEKGADIRKSDVHSAPDLDPVLFSHCTRVQVSKNLPSLVHKVDAKNNVGFPE